ncbi:CHAT domain-containing protein [Acetobacter oryzoeni]|nr:CHAT domain-containing protein [Acetobacter oryzoeni]MCP1203723.1 CHAT domain-containing protein [Acetobacter oryzoeni]
MDRSDLNAIAKKILAFIAECPDVRGGADIYCLDFATAQERSGILLAVLSGVSDEKEQPLIQRYLVIAPPGADIEEWQKAIWAQFSTTFAFLAKRKMEEREADLRRSMLQVVVADDLRHETVITLLAAQSDRTAVIVTNAAGYRDESVKSFVTPNASKLLLSEDVWVPQVHALAVAATETAKDRQVYVAIDTGKFSPTRTELQHLLASIDACGVMGACGIDDPETVLAQHVDRWDKWITEGRLGVALKDVEALPTKFDSQKPFLRIQLMSRAGRNLDALASIREEVEIDRNLDARSRTKLARIAQHANASALAIKLLEPAIAQLDNLGLLTSALDTAQDANAPKLVTQAIERLTSLYPESAIVREFRINELLADRDYSGAALFARNHCTDRSTFFYETLGQYLSVSNVPDYRSLIDKADGDVPLSESFRMACVNDALNRSLPVHAFDLVLPLPKASQQAKYGEQLLLRTLRFILLEKAKIGTWPVNEDRFADAVIVLITRLAADPARHELRIGLIELLQPAVAGTTGLAFATFIVLRLSAKPITINKIALPGKADPAWLIGKDVFLQGAFSWMASEQPMVLGRLPLPIDLLKEPADEVLSAIAKFLTYGPISGDGDDDVIKSWLGLGCAVAPYSSYPDYDLRLIRLAAGKFANVGAGQVARDLAEQALSASYGTARRRRLGWFAMADTYARQGNVIEALIAMACTFAADTEGDAEEIYQEFTCLARILRDCQLPDDAREAVAQARVMLGVIGLTEQFGLQLDTLELQIRQRQLDACGGAGFEALLADAIEHGRDVLRRGGESVPPGVLLGQLLRIARLHDIPVADDVDAVMKGLRERAGGGFDGLVETITAVRPTKNQLLLVARNGGVGRYSDDVGFDTRGSALLASRALSSSEFLSDPIGTSFALDLLADRGVALPGWDEAAVPPDLPGTIEKSAEIARQISLTGVNVVQVGFDEEGHLIRVSTVGGVVGEPVREQKVVISKSRLHEWAKHYPYAYGIDETTANLFYTTTADLRLSELPSGPTVMVAETKLQEFPPNLLFVEDKFAGRIQPMAATPSLAWLGQAQEIGLIGDGRMCAWISTAEGEGSQTLPMIAQRLEPTFERYGFEVDNGPNLPATFAGATIAVVTAHGSVNSEGRYFQMVSDEGILCVTSGELANALRNVGVVILFVCSAGRADKHPTANTVLGLSKQIIDRGCTAVIASPWPLDARVPSHWLPAFLEKWMAGANVAQANFDANKVVDQQFSNDPARGLAMTVYGNPLIARTVS